jgi:hypothetical protein
MIPEYLTKCELCYSNDEEKIITKYRAGMRLTEGNISIEEKYLTFLIRRINKHLVKEQIGQEYYDDWGNKVSFFREEITNLISK